MRGRWPYAADLERPWGTIPREFCRLLLYMASNLLKCINALRVLTGRAGQTRECLEAWIKLVCGREPQYAIKHDRAEETSMSLHNAVALIKEDHRRVESLYQDYQRLDGQLTEQRT